MPDRQESGRLKTRHFDRLDPLAGAETSPEIPVAVELIPHLGADLADLFLDVQVFELEVFGLVADMKFFAENFFPVPVKIKRQTVRFRIVGVDHAFMFHGKWFLSRYYTRGSFPCDLYN